MESAGVEPDVCSLLQGGGDRRAGRDKSKQVMGGAMRPWPSGSSRYRSDRRKLQGKEGLG